VDPEDTLMCSLEGGRVSLFPPLPLYFGCFDLFQECSLFFVDSTMGEKKLRS
jgi:hypothetical protein